MTMRLKRGLKRELAACCGAAALAALLLRRNEGAFVLAAAAVALAFGPGTRRSLAGNVIAITGGSRGLGLALADRALREGARVALLARDDEELRRARDLLGPRAHRRTMLVRCDVTSDADVADAIAQLCRGWGGIDVWVNNAGSITVGPFPACDRADFDAMLELNVHAIVRATRGLLPVFRRQQYGHIVNICSLGGKVGVPHMSAYCTAKFALAGLSAALGAELAPEGITVTTVHPGVMRVGSSIQGRFKGDPEKEYAWFSALATLPGMSVAAERAATRIIEAVRYGDAEVVFPASAKVAALGDALLPEISAWVRGKMADLFPASESSVAWSGAQSRRWLESRWWFRPLRAVARADRLRWNQWKLSDTATAGD